MIARSVKTKEDQQDRHNLREQAATFARRVATRIYNSEPIDSYVNCRLIPLNKCPGLRPIGVGETSRRIIGKTIGWILKLDIQKVPVYENGN